MAMEIKTSHMGKAKAICSEFRQRPKSRQRSGRASGGGQGKVSGVPCWTLVAWERGGLPRNGASCVIGQGCRFGFLCLALSWKQGQKLRKLSVTDHVLAILGQLLWK